MGKPHLTIPAGTAPGTYYVGILVDRTNAVSESNESNNYVSRQITVTAEPGPPVISSIYDDLIDPYADYCINSQGQTFSGYNYNVYFNYNDPDGDASPGDGAWVTVNDTYWSWVTIGGDGFSGTVTVSYCSTTAGNYLRLKMYDGEGQVSNQLSISLTDYL